MAGEEGACSRCEKKKSALRARGIGREGTGKGTDQEAYPSVASGKGGETSISSSIPHLLLTDRLTINRLQLIAISMSPEVVHQNGSLSCDSGGSLGVGHGGSVTEGEDVRVLGMLSGSRVDRYPSSRVGFIVSDQSSAFALAQVEEKERGTNQEANS